MIVNTIAGVPAATFQSINKRLASPVAPGALTVSCPCSWALLVACMTQDAAVAVGFLKKIPFHWYRKS